jgi:hypothetical protein
VADESKRLGRPLTPGEYPGRISDAFMFPSSMSLGRKNGFLSRLVIAEAGKTNSWEDMFARMEQYKKREGHCNVPRSHKEDGANLGTWVPRQRIEKRKGELSADKSRRLESIGMVWEPLFVAVGRYYVCPSGSV